jgi:hypothetical protein
VFSSRRDTRVPASTCGSPTCNRSSNIFRAAP